MKQNKIETKNTGAFRFNSEALYMDPIEPFYHFLSNLFSFEHL